MLPALSGKNSRNTHLSSGHKNRKMAKLLGKNIENECWVNMVRFWEYFINKQFRESSRRSNVECLVHLNGFRGPIIKNRF